MAGRDDVATDGGARHGGLRRAAVKGAGWSLLQAWGGRLISTAVFFFLARLLVPEDFGLVALATIVVELGQLLMNRGFGASLIQREEVSDDDLDAVFWFALGAGALLFGVAFATAGLLADAFGEPGFAPVLRVLSINWMLSAFWIVPQNVLQRELEFASLAIRRLLAVAVSGAVATAMALWGAGVWSLVALTTTQSLVSIVVLWNASNWRPSRRFSWSRIRSMQGFAWRVSAISITRFFAVRGEGLLVGAVLGPITLGYYAVAQRFITLMREIFTSSVGQVAFPVFSRLQDDPGARKRALRSVVRLTSLVAFPAFVGLAVLAPDVVAVLLGDEWEPSVVLVQLLALHGLRMSVTYFVAGAILSTGAAALQLRVQLAGIAVKALALVVGIGYGVEGIAAAVVISSYVTLPLGLWALRRTTGLAARSFLRETLVPAIGAMVMAGVVLGCRWWLEKEVTSVAMLLIGAAAGALAYLGALVVIGRPVLSEARTTARELVGRRGARRPTTVPAGV